MHRQCVKYSRKLRKEQTPHERKLWFLLRGRRLEGFKFYRQYEIGKYIVDFCCPEKSIVIELDGGGHGKEEQQEKDRLRDLFLEKEGFSVIRIWNHELIQNELGVLEEILSLIRRHPSPQPSPQGEREKKKEKLWL